MSQLAIAADHAELRRLRPWLDANTAHLDPLIVGRIELCMHELASNVIDHSGAQRLALHLIANAGSMQIEIHDSGAPLELPAIGELEPHPRVRGYGMVIAEQLASDLSYERRDSVNVWRARFDVL